jgi:hypothetical protein
MLHRPSLFPLESLACTTALALLFSPTTSAQTPAHTTSSIPFVGCPSDGQLGPQPAPTGSAPHQNFPPEISSKLAYYEGPDRIGTLAPRDWHCFALIGSDGDFLYVAPEPIDAAKLLDHKHWHGFTGPAIQLSAILGDTSGRMEVAPIVARVFPKYRRYVEIIIAEGFESAKDFPFGPFPTDKLHYENDHLVDFTTPQNTKGLGTASWLLPNNLPISGIILYDPSKDGDHEMNQLCVRLPPQMQDLTPAIIDKVRSAWNSPKK